MAKKAKYISHEEVSEAMARFLKKIHIFYYFSSKGVI